jgi:CRP/FNR family cyclic AMP-dependent transcriptional regulator
MLERFRGDAGRRLLVEALIRQSLVQGDRDVASRLADIGELRLFPAKTVLIEQEGCDNDLYVLLDGRVQIEINDRFVAERSGGQHVGEMALIDPMGRRTARVTALTDVVALIISEENFAAIADASPRLWRNLAIELVSRMRQRASMLRAPNPEPRVFIGSSLEGIAIAQEIQSGLANLRAIVQLWSQNVFSASAGTMEALEHQTAEADFAVLVLSADDIAIVRDRPHAVARDNVVFELGLFTGALGRHRTYMVMPREADIKVPTDMLGITALMFTPPAEVKDLAARLGPVCTELSKLIHQHGPR